MRDQAFYHRWVFKPSDAQVIIEPDYGAPHSALSEHVGEREAVHGFAFPIHGGWRILDYEYRTVEDPFIRNQVIKALRYKGK